MTPSRASRQPWEYRDGPQVGEDVPITSEPRDEEQPGVPRTPDQSESPNGQGARSESENASGAGGEDEETEEREVRAADPGLSSETNQRLTSELRDVVGSDHVRVPADRPQASRGEHPQQQGAAARFNFNHFQFVRNLAIVLTFAAVVSLITGNWWLLPLAAGVHALGTMAVTLTITRMTTISEHPSPEVAAALAEEGVANPDEHFSRMVEEFREQPNGVADERGATEVLSPGFNERSVPAEVATAEAGAEQSSAITPTSQPSRPAGEGGAPDVLIWATTFSLFVLSIVVPATGGGGWLWMVTAVMVPLLIGWVVLQRIIAKGGHLKGRAPLIAIIVCTVAAVALFCAVVALGFQH
ncbi:MAG: hypothetical protein JO153_15875 [Solirubrobacterales bacterium]|nr:hypothetical protein [Solirubrobacterales bacterium]